MRMLVKDIATTLGQPEAPLLEALRSKTIRPYLFEDAAEQDKELDMRCQHLCQRPDAPAYLQPCGQPVVWHATPCPNGHRCAEHLYAAPVPRPAGLPRRRPLQMDGVDEDLRGPYTLYHTDDGTVLDGTGAPRGRYTADSQRLTLFQVLDDEAEADDDDAAADKDAAAAR
jgi:hypothetical protein